MIWKSDSMTRCDAFPMPNEDLNFTKLIPVPADAAPDHAFAKLNGSTPGNCYKNIGNCYKKYRILL